jgi:hypothetical protein
MTRIIIQHDPDIPWDLVSLYVGRAIDTQADIITFVDNIEIIRRRTRPDVAAHSFIVRRVPPITT